MKRLKNCAHAVKGWSAGLSLFPEPDLPPLSLSRYGSEKSFSLPELPLAREERFREQYGLTEYDAGVLVRAPHLADIFEETVALDIPLNLQPTGCWVFARLARQTEVVSAESFGELLELISSGKINNQGKLS